MAESVPAPSAPTIGSRRGRRVWKFAGAVLTSIAVLLSTAMLWSWATERATQTETQHHSYTRPVVRIVLDLSDGDINLTSGEPGSVAIERRLEWSTSRPRIEERWTGGSLAITSRCPTETPLGAHSRCAVGYAMRVPPDVAIDARTAASRIDVRDLGGDLRLSESSGDVTVTNITGRLWVETTSGRVAGANLRCRQVEVRATSGDIAMGFARPPEHVTATTRAGNVDITVPGRDPYRVGIETSAGDRDVTIRHYPGATRIIGVQTTRGDVRIRYAS